MSQFGNTHCIQNNSGYWVCHPYWVPNSVHVPGVPPGTYPSLPSPPGPSPGGQTESSGATAPSGTISRAPMPAPSGPGVITGTQRDIATIQRNVGAMLALYQEAPPEEYAPPEEAPPPEELPTYWGEPVVGRREPEPPPEPIIPAAVFLYQVTPPGGDKIDGMPLPGAGVMLQDESPVVCKCEILCGPPCIDETKLPVSEDGWKSNPDCETQVDESIALRVTLTGNPNLKNTLRVYSPSDHVRFGEMRFVGYGPHAGGLPGLWPIWDLSCRERELRFPLVPCDSKIDMLVCADKEGEYEIIAEWGNIKCKRTIKVKECVCACFQPEIDAAWKLLMECPDAADFIDSIGIEEGPKIAGQPEFNVICVEKEELEKHHGPGTQIQADWWLPTMSARIRCGAKGVLAWILFEATNAASRIEHAAVDKNAKENIVSKDDFVRQHEKIEWEGLRKHSEIAKKCIASGHWGPETDKYGSAMGPGGAYEKFEDYLKAMKAENHSSVFEDWWDNHARK